MSRLSFRPRPLDINKRLRLLKTPEELEDEEDAVKIVQHVVLEAEHNKEAAPAPTRKGGTEIPTPRFEPVDSYTTDYTPTFKQPPSYVRSKPARSETGDFVEYDLDDEDDEWLFSFNMERKILSAGKFEWMLYKLEILDHKQRERAGLGPMVLGNAVPLLLQREQAYEALSSQVTRMALLSAVYDYWKSKRERWQKPILRRLQPAPSVTDTNPFNVFRPRERIHRPHTRRMQRRENDAQSFEKLRQVRWNLQEAKLLINSLTQRERKKKELVEVERDIQQVHIQRKHDMRGGDDDALLASSMHAMHPPPPKKPNMQRRFEAAETATLHPSGLSSDQINGHFSEAERRRSRLAQPVVTPVTDADVSQEGDQGELARYRKKKRKRNIPNLRGGRPVKKMMVMKSVDPVLIFAQPLDLEKLAASGIEPPPPLSYSPQNGCCEPKLACRARIGRGGRILFDRWNALEGRPLRESIPTLLPPSQPPLPQSEDRSHPPPPRLEGTGEREVNGPIPSSSNLNSSDNGQYTNHMREKEPEVSNLQTH